MKLVTFREHSGVHIGALLDEGAVLDLSLASAYAPAFDSMIALIEAGAEAWDRARILVRQAATAAVRPVDSVRLLAPLPVPPQMRDFMCFEKHVQQALCARARLMAGQEADPVRKAALLLEAEQIKVPEVWYQQPVYYKCNRFAVSGPEDVIRWPSYSNFMDYECELACVIGKGGRDIPAARAHEHIFGFTVFNDFSARDAQGREMDGKLGPAKGKDFDTANAMGPCLVTLDEIGDPHALQMSVRLNGTEVSRGSSQTMHWRFEELIAHVSRDETLHAGEILGSGTVGDGCGFESLRFLEDGDVVELEIERIGVLRNRLSRMA